jgi:hypothetical protein
VKELTRGGAVMSKAEANEFDSSAHEKEVQERWGNTQAFKESHIRTSGYTKAEFQAARLESDQAIALLIEAMEEGFPPDSPRAINAARAHQDAISHWYYDCTDEIHIGLADMYINDARFTQYYETRHPGLAQYLHDAIYAKFVGVGS